MGGDPSGDSNFSGVKRPSFDELERQHRRAASRLDECARALWAELNLAGLDTSPALRIRDVAERVRRQAQDLRRRRQLVHEMERGGFDFGFCTPQGTWFSMPDRYHDQLARLEGRRAAELAKKAAGGDRNALAQLDRYAAKAASPHFAKALLEGLGAKGVVRLPAALAKQVREALDREDAQESGRFSADAKQAMRVLSIALSVGTDPDQPGYVGDEFLKQLAEQGGQRHDLDGLSFFGYQSLALVWRAHQRQPPFSKRFMEIVGRDAIVFEREQLGEQWAATEDRLGRSFGARQRAMLDLATMLNLGDALIPGTSVVKAEGQPRHSVIDDLFYAASTSRQASQALLDHTPPGWEQSTLTYLLTIRLNAFHHAGDYASFGSAMEAALAGRDDVSRRLTNEALQALTAQVGRCFGRDKDGKLEIKDRDQLERLAFLREPLGRAMAANIDKIFEVYEAKAPEFKRLEASDLDRMLLLVARDDQAFKELVRAESERMWDQIKGSYQHHNGEYVLERILPESRLFGHLLEARRLALVSESGDDEQARQDLRNSVRDVIGLLVSPGGKLGAKLAGGIGERIEGKVASLTYDKLADQIANRMIQQDLSMNEALQKAQDDRELVTSLIDNMIISSKIAHGKWSPEDLKDLKGRPFATNDQPPKIKPLDELTNLEFDRLIVWARDHSNIESTKNEARQEMNDSSDHTFHENLKIDRY